MFNGNLYGLVITMLTFVIAVVMTMRQVEQTGVHIELTIRPAIENRLDAPERQVKKRLTEQQPG